MCGLGNAAGFRWLKLLLGIGLALMLVGCGVEQPLPVEAVAQTSQALTTEQRKVTFTLPANVTFTQVTLAANGSLKVDDRAQVLAGTGFGLTTNAGVLTGAASNYGTDTKVGSITSTAAVALGARTRVTGDVVSGKTVTPGSGTVVTGTTTQNAVLTPVQNLSWNVTLQLGTQDVTVAGGSSKSINPGAYHNVTASPNGTLTLNGAGIYYFDTLDLEASSKFVLNPGTGTIVIYVRTTWVYRTAVSGATADKLLLVYLASTPVFVETTFNGTIVAPNASMRLAVGNSIHSGALFSHDVELDPGSTINARSFGGWSQIPFTVIPTLSCVDHRASDGKYAAVLGYYNPNTTAVAVPVGTDNAIAPSPQGRGQPTSFLPVRAPTEFSVDFGTATSLTWTLQGTTLTVPRTATACATSPTFGLLADTTVTEASPKANFGSDIHLNVGPGIHSLVRFDRDAVKKALGNGLQVRHATLELTRTSGTQPAVEAFMMATGSWMEGGATWDCGVDTDATTTGESCTVGTTWKMGRSAFVEAAEVTPWLKRTAARQVAGVWASGKVTFDVTRDVWNMLGSDGFKRGASWVVALQLGDSTSTTQFGSRESVSKPRLLLDLSSVPDTTAGGRGVLDIKVDATVIPKEVAATPLPDGTVRPWVGFEDPLGRHGDFVDQELVVHVATAADATTIANRWGGKVTSVVPPPAAEPERLTMARVRVDATRGNTVALAPRLRGIDNRPGGTHRVTTATGLGTFAIAVEEALAGTRVALNWLVSPTVPTSHDWSTRNIADGALDGNFPKTPKPGSNAFSWPGFANCNRIVDPLHPDAFTCSNLFPGGEWISQYFNVADAWRTLALGGKLIPASVNVGLADMGWEPDADYPPLFTSDAMNPTHSNTQRLVPFHGDVVVRAGFGIPGNTFGGAGPGGPVANLDAMSLYVDENSKIEEAIRYLRADNNKLVNFSGAGDIPAVGTIFTSLDTSGPYSNVPLFASAGNENIDVDEEDCAIACWEAQSVEPCENDGVLCIGGLGYASTGRDVESSSVGSNWGSDGSIDFVGPWWPLVAGEQQMVTPNPPIPTLWTTNGGTSSASPYMAGVGALLFASNPALSGDEMKTCLAAGGTSLYFGTGYTLMPDALKSLACSQLGACRGPVTLANLASFLTCDPGGDFPPYVKIQNPVNGTTVGRGSLFSALATGTDAEQGELFVTWSSSADGPRGQTFSDTAGLLTLTTLGVQTLTASVTAGGVTVSDSISVTVVDAPPVVTIVHPATDGSPVGQGLSTRFSATVSAAGLGIAAPPSAAFTWGSIGPDGVTADFTGQHGSNIYPTFTTLGTHTVSVTFVDPFGESATATRTVVVDVATVPTVTIDAPEADASGEIEVADGQPTTLHASSTFGADIYTWWLIVNGKTISIANGNGVTWDPGTSLNVGCHALPGVLEVSATNSATGDHDTDDVAIWVFPPFFGSNCIQ